MDTYDLHLAGNCEESVLKSSLENAVRLGYGVVAVGYTCPSQHVQGNEKKMKLELPFAPPAVKLDTDSKTIISASPKNFRQLSRVNVILTEGAETHKLRQDNIQSYDLLAVQPTNEKMFHMACTKLEIDIVCLDMTEKLPFYFKRVAINAAIERGLYFEIPYAPAIRDATSRRNILNNAMTLTALCRGKNCIITSQATKPLEIRGPYDAANLGLLFGLSEQEAKNAVSANCRALIYHAATRRNTIKSVMSVKQLSELSASDQWKVTAGQEAPGIVSDDSPRHGREEGDTGEGTIKGGPLKKHKLESPSERTNKQSRKRKKGCEAGVD